MYVAKVDHGVNDIIQSDCKSLSSISMIVKLIPEIKSLLFCWWSSLANTLPWLGRFPFCPLLTSCVSCPLFILVVEVTALDLGPLDWADRWLLELREVAVCDLCNCSLLVTGAPSGVGGNGGSRCMISCRALLTPAKFLWMSPATGFKWFCLLARSGCSIGGCMP